VDGCREIRDVAQPARYCFPVPWEIEAFRRSVGGLSPASVRAYSGDVERFTGWAARGGAEGPADVDRIVLRRYLAFLATRRYSKATISRTAASLRSYFQWCTRRGLVGTDPAARPGRRYTHPYDRLFGYSAPHGCHPHRPIP
jgi:integrase